MNNDYSELTDEVLAERLKGGESSAYDELVRRHQGRVYGVAYRLTGNRDDALDVAQDALLKAYRRIDAWQPTGTFVSWLMRLTANQAIDNIRKINRRRMEPLEFDTGGGSSREPSERLTEQAVREGEIEDRVQEALAVLSPSQRTVFVLRHYEGLSLAEIAPVLGCTVGSVKVHLFRALKKMRQELEDLR